MTSRSLKFLTNKPKFLFLIGFIVLLFIFNLSVNLFLLKSQEKITRAINESLEFPVAFTKLSFVFPHFITIMNLHISEKGQSPLTTIPLTITQFSILDLLTKNQLTLTTLTFKNPLIDGDQLYHRYPSWIEKITALIKKFPRKNLNLIIEQAQIHFKQASQKDTVIVSNLSLNFKQDHITSHGSFYTSHNDLIFQHDLEADLKPGHFLWRLKYHNWDRQLGFLEFLMRFGKQN